MKYMGSKRRIRKHILPIMLDGRTDETFVDVFCGGCNLIESVTGKRIANDNNTYLIAMFKAMQNGWLPPKIITEDDYNQIKDNKENYPPELVAYVGFAMSFGGKWFAGYRRDKKGQQGSFINMMNQSRRSRNDFIRQSELLKDVEFYSVDYADLPIPDGSIVYCDPPYANTTKYKSDFDHNRFWQWVRDLSEHCDVYVSEYTAPDDFEAVWAKAVKVNIDHASSDDRTEKLFTIRRQIR